MQNSNAILDLYGVPTPTLTFHERLQRRLAFYNRRQLYKRKCDLTGETIVSMFSPDKPYKAYKTREWFSDNWNPENYGRDFDFTRPFFEQFNELMLDVPHNALAVLDDNINSDFTNDNYALKNCYLVFDGETSEDAYYGESFFGLQNCMDFLFLENSSLCYECINCKNCYNLKYSTFSQNCSDSWFLRDCIGCKNCFGCANLRQKEFCIFNKQKTEEEYKKFISEFESGSYEAVQKMANLFHEFHLTEPVRATRGVQNIDVIGDNVSHSKNAFECYDGNELQDCSYCTDCLKGAKDCVDIHVWGGDMEQCYNCMVVGVNIKKVFCSCAIAMGCTEIYYSSWCARNCHNLFGCFALAQKQYCILNKQYSKEEYLALLPKIIEHMKSTGEWGEFFPAEISPFGYNESLAQDFFPLSRDEVLAKGWKWCDFTPEISAQNTIATENLPDKIEDVSDDILSSAIQCEITGKLFKIIPQELKFYREHRLPLPRRHSDQRHWDRLKFKNPYKLFSRICAKCSSPIQTTYSPDRPEKVYCKKCYLEEIY